MIEVVTIVALTATMTVVAVVGPRLRLPYSILMLAIGALVAFVPAVPDVAIGPDAIKYVILPPLLYSAGWYTTWSELTARSFRIAGLSIGLVIASTIAVGVAATWLISGLPLLVGLLIGAIVSPPDAVAATEARERLGLPRRTSALLEGESLFNDATALIIYKIAIVAIMAGTSLAAVSLTEATLGFVIAVAGAAALGLAVGWLVTRLHRATTQPVLETVLTLQTPFLAFLPAEALGLSGVMAVVVAGLYVGRNSPRVFSARARLEAIAVWDTLIFLLTGLVFALIGLRLRDIPTADLASLLQTAAILSGVAIAVRIAWVFGVAAIARLGRRRRDVQDFREAAVVSWAGMRGVVSLAAALAVPLTVADGSAFPNRDAVLVTAFVIILVTLVGQGLTLPFVIRWADLSSGAGSSEEAERTSAELGARRAGVDAALRHLTDREEPLTGGGHAVEAATVRAGYLARRERLGSAAEDRQAAVSNAEACHPHHGALAAERAEIVAWRDQGRIDDEILHRILRELDLAEALTATRSSVVA